MTPGKLSTPALGVLCVEDNADVAEALKVKLSRTAGFEWKGSLTQADQLLLVALRDQPRLVIFDLDMPGKDPFAVLAELAAQCPEARAVMFSGHVRGDLVRRAVDNGAWGYVSKNDGEDELLTVLRRVAGGELAFSTEAMQAYRS